MTTQRPAVVILACVLFSTLTLAQQPLGRPGDDEPQVQSLLGKRLYARPDADGAVAKADAALAADPQNLDLLLAAARARDGIWQYRQAIELYSRGVARAPQDVRFLRFRGHRYISTRKFDLAVADLERAAALAPTSFDVAYHLALAYYLRRDFDKAASVYQGCLDASADPLPLPDGWRSCTGVKGSDGDRVAIADWLYRSLRRSGRHEAAKALAATIGEGLEVGENAAYYSGLRFYVGRATEAQVLPMSADADNTFATVGYAVGNYHFVEGRTKTACAIWRRIIDAPTWNAFGYIAAEVELAAGEKGPCGKF